MVTRHQAQSADFGPTWPEVEGFGAGPNKQFCGFAREGKSVKYAGVLTPALLAVLRNLIVI